MTMQTASNGTGRRQRAGGRVKDHVPIPNLDEGCKRLGIKREVLGQYLGCGSAIHRYKREGTWPRWHQVTYERFLKEGLPKPESQTKRAKVPQQTQLPAVVRHSRRDVPAVTLPHSGDYEVMMVRVPLGKASLFRSLVAAYGFPFETE